MDVIVTGTEKDRKIYFYRNQVEIVKQFIIVMLYKLSHIQKKKIQKLILENHIFKDKNKLLKYVFVN